MSSAANVLIHPQPVSGEVRRDLLVSLRLAASEPQIPLRQREADPKMAGVARGVFAARTDNDCQAIYEQGSRPPRKCQFKGVHVIGLGCGGGQKDTRLLKLLKTRGRKISYTPCDVSAAMVLVARQTALAVLPEKNCFPFVCDLATTDNLPASRHPPPASDAFASLVTFFGMIPNFEPQIILPKLASFVVQGFAAVQREPRAREKITPGDGENPATIRQSAHPGLAADVPARPRVGARRR